MLMPEEFYIIEVQASEWNYVIQRLVSETEGLTPGDVIVTLEMPFPVYHLRKEKFNVATLARSIGATIRAVEGAKTIRLEPFETSGNLPNPTVPYSGEA